MKTRILATTATLLALGGCAFEQPPVRCVVGRGGHAVRYTLKSGTGACAQKQAEELGVQKYNPPGAPQTVALQPDTLFQLGLQHEQDPATSPISIGQLNQEFPGEDGFCRVEQVSPGQQRTGEAGLEVRYEWSDVRFHTSAAAPGTQWAATVKYSAGSCSATYEAVGVFPVVYCALKQDDFTGRPIREPDGSILTDPELCKKANPITYLALDQSAAVRCDAPSGLCVLDATDGSQLPAFKP